MAQIVKSILSEGITPIAELAPDVPADVAELVMRMLAREPAQRPADLREVAAALAPPPEPSARAVQSAVASSAPPPESATVRGDRPPSSAPGDVPARVAPIAPSSAATPHSASASVSAVAAVSAAPAACAAPALPA